MVSFLYFVIEFLTTIQVINVQFDFGPGRSLNPEALQSIVDFVYSREILLNVDTVQAS